MLCYVQIFDYEYDKSELLNRCLFGSCQKLMTEIIMFLLFGRFKNETVLGECKAAETINI